MSRVESKSIEIEGGDASSTNNDQKRQSFGNRFLTGEKNVFDFNAW
jgi:hypothetical protein